MKNDPWKAEVLHEFILRTSTHHLFHEIYFFSRRAHEIPHCFAKHASSILVHKHTNSVPYDAMMNTHAIPPQTLTLWLSKNETCCSNNFCVIDRENGYFSYKDGQFIQSDIVFPAYAKQNIGRMYSCAFYVFNG